MWCGSKTGTDERGRSHGRTFVLENEWYLRITETGTSLTIDTAVQDFVMPLVRATSYAARS
jgi:hypothetical protein